MFDFLLAKTRTDYQKLGTLTKISLSIQKWLQPHEAWLMGWLNAGNMFITLISGRKDNL